MISRRLSNDQTWEKRLFDSNRLTPGQKEDLHKVVVYDFYQSNGGRSSFAKFWDLEEEGQELKDFMERYNLFKSELLTLGFYAITELPIPPFKTYITTGV